MSLLLGVVGVVLGAVSRGEALLRGSMASWRSIGHVRQDSDELGSDLIDGAVDRSVKLAQGPFAFGGLFSILLCSSC